MSEGPFLPLAAPALPGGGAPNAAAQVEPVLGRVRVRVRSGWKREGRSAGPVRAGAGS